MDKNIYTWWLNAAESNGTFLIMWITFEHTEHPSCAHSNWKAGWKLGIANFLVPDFYNHICGNCGTIETISVPFVERSRQKTTL